MSNCAGSAIPAYMKSKCEADKNLARKTTFERTMLMLGGLGNGPGTGRSSIGETHLAPATSVSLRHRGVQYDS